MKNPLCSNTGRRQAWNDLGWIWYILSLEEPYMNRFEFLKKLKLPPISRPTPRQMIFWGGTLVAAVAVFLFARGLTDCWQLTQLPGRLPENCTNSSETPTGDYTPQPGETAIA